MNPDIKNSLVLGAVFLFAFLLLTPLGVFNDWIPPLTQTGYYSIATIDPGDDTGYYAYLRSAFFDGDWDFINEGNYAHAEHFTPTGYVFNNWQIGQSILFLPFFMVGHLAALIYNSLGYAVSVDGYSAPYYMATAVASQTYLFAGLLLLFNILKKRFGGSIALVSTLAIWLGSPLIYYTFIRQRMAHTAEFFLAVVFVYFWLKERNSEDYFKHAILGGVLGLLCMVRVINVGFFALYLIDQLVLIKQSGSTLRLLQCKTFAARCFYFSGFWFLAFTPQLFAWYKIDGIPMPALHSSIAGNLISSLSIGDALIKLRSMFFGPRWGLVFSSPLIIIGFCGLMVSEVFKKSRLSLMAVGLTFIAIVIFVYNYLDAYEFRYLTPVLPVFAIGLAAILNKLSKNVFWFYSAIAFGLICVLGQYFMLIQYKVTMPYNDPEFTVKALGAIPSTLFERVELLLRSSNFIRLIFLDHPQAWNYRDFLFLIAFPLAQFICVCLVCFSFYWIKKNSGRTFKVHSKFLLGFGMMLIFSSITFIQMVTPSKATQEINMRRQYTQVMKKADLALEKGQNDRAINLYLKAQNLVPDLPTPDFKIGLSLDKEKKFNEANKYYKKVIDKYPSNAATLYNLGINLMLLGQFQEAGKNLKIAVRVVPGNKKNYNALARIYAKKGDLNTARKFFQIALTLDPKYGKVHANLALLFTMMQNAVEARRHLNEAIKLGVQNPLVLKLSELYKVTAGEDGE